ncbi:FAD-containing monooxygenase EthA [Nocardia sp. 852002-20019_SCH5090214]|jgi:cation diffusion facilitator CzcD-associated flavoprotein CzcO|uniref:NAD(P)/FAD-dependent oxidoreductase n=1 Tax=Nocardia nova TaxID=37330 RepID=A0A2S5ZWW5_9NOCA|nr:MULTISPECIES: NAD(P)/FAD-dependent oxidoreductase [Nocardia]MBV7707427.1 NAD(P)/FAD-dependent oxidoreductase [Nocardia nova]OBA51345.1 FAD-containing monooxygenase EthA [Nocardia sp. 852002-20019_SCH5090214]PPI89525.1 NAD(P)/FAD-dependent oxidoreductase [Nocardia nova]PPJ02636.1 NAD(P)/FAD-dependent oxidoreductase [Nocardia nova]PPJ22112.1 NAD(P)/FAD-dependent oxidoreductase [Nocardia nova]
MTAAGEYVDVVIVGAGLSGIGAGYRVQTELPGKSYAILEARESLGGTWDLFRYPGIRSDSDMFTLGYPFEPWRDAKSIADGPSILRYITETARRYGIDKHIRYGTKVVAAQWSSAESRWTLTLRQGDAERTLSCRFLYSCAGYYDYDEGHAPEFPGVETFSGTMVHPQFWPEDLDYAGKKVVVVGSGATAVTLVPAMAEQAELVTMLQRSPTWISAVPGRDKQADKIRELLPAGLAHRVIRTKNILFNVGFYQYCRRRPQAARKLLTGLTTRILKDEKLVAEHFTPEYNPWDQRLCAVPDADFFKAMRKGKAEVVTDHIDTFVPEGIRLTSGRVLPADIVISATGLKLLAFGGITLEVDGEPVNLSDRFVWQGTMLTGVPNFAVCIGYTNASWTLRADLTSRLVCKVIAHMDRRGYDAVVPQPQGELTEHPLLDLASGYIQRSIGDFPRQGDRHPWKVRQNYLLDSATTMRTNLDKTLQPVRRTAALSNA